jgi:hypothetical protein
VKIWTVRRQKLLLARWRSDPKRQSVEYWRRFFVHVSESEFLTGGGNKGWKPDLEWLLAEGHFAKVIEGFYHGAEQ